LPPTGARRSRAVVLSGEARRTGLGLLDGRACDYPWRMTRLTQFMRCPPGHVYCAACEEPTPSGAAMPVHRAWSRRFPWRVYRRGDALGRWVDAPLYLCPAHVGLVEEPATPHGG